MCSKISVIIPCYNLENYVEETVKSVVAQTYQNLEIILVDDGSTDQTYAVLQKLCLTDERIRIFHQENKGVSYARMRGINEATGEWITFVDGDDVIASNMYELLMENAKKYDADISHCGYQMIYPDGKCVLYHGTNKSIFCNRTEGVKALLTAEYVEPGLWNKIFRRELFEAINKSSLWNPEIKINEDFLMNYILFKEAKQSIFMDIPLYSYILRSGSASTSKLSSYKIMNPLQVISLIKDDVCENAELFGIAYSRYIRVLINNALLKDWPVEADIAISKLKKEVANQEIRYCNSNKLKLMAFFVAYARPVYQMIRALYDGITGNDRKYKI